MKALAKNFDPQSARFGPDGALYLTDFSFNAPFKISGVLGGSKSATFLGDTSEQVPTGTMLFMPGALPPAVTHSRPHLSAPTAAID